jgi:hypothetical protein
MRQQRNFQEPSEEIQISTAVRKLEQFFSQFVYRSRVPIAVRITIFGCWVVPVIFMLSKISKIIEKL